MIRAFSTMALSRIAKRKKKTVTICLVQSSSSATSYHCLVWLLKAKQELALIQSHLLKRTTE